MTEVKIETGVPLVSRYNRPNKRKVRALKYNYPIKDMNPGESIFVPITDLPQRVQSGKDAGTHYTNNIVRAHVKRYKLKNRTYQHRQIYNDGKGVVGVRIWRTS